MSDPIAPAPISGVPQPPPKLDRKRLWISLLLPPGVMVLAMIILVIGLNIGAAATEERLFTLVCVLACLSSIIGWVIFIRTMAERFRGGSLALLIIAYPMVQFTILFSIFFVGCLAAIWSDGYF